MYPLIDVYSHEDLRNVHTDIDMEIDDIDVILDDEYSPTRKDDPEPGLIPEFDIIF